MQLFETQQEREQRERAETQRRFTENQNTEILKSKIVSYKARIHNSAGEQALLTRQAKELIEKAQKEAAEKIAMAASIEESLPKLRTLLARAEHELRVMNGHKSKSTLAKSTLGL